MYSVGFLSIFLVEHNIEMIKAPIYVSVFLSAYLSVYRSICVYIYIYIYRYIIYNITSQPAQGPLQDVHQLGAGTLAGEVSSLGVSRFSGYVGLGLGVQRFRG